VKVLVTGATGQVGSRLCRMLDQENYECIPIGRSDWDMASDPQKGYRIVFMSSPDAVVNTAAYTAVDDAEDDEDAAHAVNASAVGSLSSACSELQIPLIHLSTDYVFDGAKTAPYRETDTPNPQTAYGRSKLASEFEARRFSKHVILRLAWVFSDHGHNFVKTMVRVLEKREAVTVVDDQIGCPTSASSIASTIISILDCYRFKPSLPWGTYHFCGDTPVTWYEFAKEIRERLGDLAVADLLPCSTSDYQRRAKRPQNSVLSNDKLFEVFNVQPCDWRSDLNPVIQSILDQSSEGA
jgi:dTDP-4-dehydrorhamnose reductase